MNDSRRFEVIAVVHEMVRKEPLTDRIESDSQNLVALFELVANHHGVLLRRRCALLHECEVPL